MNETIKTIMERRSIRKYKADQIKDEELDQILQAALFAPSAINQHPCKFIVVQDKSMRDRMVHMNQEVMGNENMDPYYGAPTIVVVLADSTKIAPIEDASLAIGNMANAAHALGIGSCWVHREKQMFESEDGKEILKELGISEDYIGVGALILGYPEGDYPKAAPRDEESIIIIK